MEVSCNMNCKFMLLFIVICAPVFVLLSFYRLVLRSGGFSAGSDGVRTPNSTHCKEDFPGRVAFVFNEECVMFVLYVRAAVIGL